MAYARSPESLPALARATGIPEPRLRLVLRRAVSRRQLSRAGHLDRQYESLSRAIERVWPTL